MPAFVWKTLIRFFCCYFEMVFGLEIPFVKSKSDVKLHISKDPNLKSWIVVTGFLCLSAYSIDYVIAIWVQCIIALAILFISFTQFYTFEDWIFDYNVNKVFYTRCNLLDKLHCHVSSCETISMSSIIDVQVVWNSGLVLVLKNGDTMSIAPYSVDYNTLQILRYHISSFLSFEQIEYYRPVIIGEVNGQLVKAFKPDVDAACAVENGRNSFRSSVNIRLSP